MAKKITESIDRTLSELKARGEYGGAKANEISDILERVMRELKVFNQKRHRSEQMESDLNRRFEAVVLSLEKITRALKENGLLNVRQ